MDKSAPAQALLSDFQLADETATVKFGTVLAPCLTDGGIVCLHGDLGAGKTALARAVIRTLCSDPALEVPSPTFNLLQVYDQCAPAIWHFDLYRLDNDRDILNLGWDDALDDEALILVEWPERLGSLLPGDRLDVRLAHLEGGGRTIRLEPHGIWRQRFPDDA